MSCVRSNTVLAIGLLAFLLLLLYVYTPDFVATDLYMKAFVPQPNAAIYILAGKENDE